MAGKNGGARPGAGRKAGDRNKETLRRELIAAKQQLEQIKNRESKGHKLAIDVLNDAMHVAYGMMAKHQPLAPNEAQMPGREPNVAEFKEWLGITVSAAKELAPFQSAKFKSVSLHVEAPIGGAPENPGAAPLQAMSPAEAYRMLRDHDVIDLSASSVVDRPPAPVAKLPARKQAKG